MKNPLENDKNTRPQNKVRNPKPGELLKQRKIELKLTDLQRKVTDRQ